MTKKNLCIDFDCLKHDCEESNALIRNILERYKAIIYPSTIVGLRKYLYSLILKKAFYDATKNNSDNNKKLIYIGGLFVFIRFFDGN